MRDKKFLMEHNLMDAYNKFMHLINETTYFSGNLDEEGEDEEQPQDPQQQGDPQAGADMGGGAPADIQGGEGMAPQGQDMQGGGDMGGMDDSQFDPSQQPPVDAQGGMGDPQGMGGGMPPMDDAPMGDEEPSEENDVIDVDDITNAQEKTNSRVNKVGRNLGKVDDKIKDVLSLIQSLKGMIDANNAEIEAFKTEFERRNPTPTEKLNLRSLDSYPFNTNPTKYWQGKAEQPEVSGKRYEAYADNGEPTAKQDEYEITKDDVTDFSPNSIEDSFHIDDDLRMTIEKIFGL